MMASTTIKQEWLVNLKNTCGEKYDVNEQGELVANENGMYKGYVAEYACVVGLLGLYLGQVMFRFTGSGRLSHDSYSKNATTLLQLIFSGINVCLYKLPVWLSEIFDTDSMPLWAKALFVTAIT